MKVKDKDKIEEQLIAELKIMQHQITETKEPAVACEKLEETLWRSAEQLQTLTETAPIIIIRSDFKTKVTYVNKKFEEVTGYSRDEVVGQSWTALGIVSVKNVRLFLKRMIEKLKGRPPSPMEVQLKRKDGEWIWASGIGEIIREQGKPAGFQIIAQDITEHKRVEAKLKESERKYRNLYEEAPVAYFAIDANGYIQMANPHVTRLLGYTVDELIGRPLFDLCLNSATGKAKTEEILLKLKAKKEVSEEEQDMINDRLKLTALPMVAYLGNSQITIRDLIHMKNGDVLRLDKRIDDLLEIEIGGSRKYFGRPGVSGKRKAIKIIRPVTAEDVAE